jgi:tRNA (guanine26-N2/guanine27-N2)-dimethyltransferase
MIKQKEGKAVFLVPDQLVTRRSEVFYNPEMRFARDLTISALRIYQKSLGRKLVVCDPLAASGIRGIRIAKEVSGIEKVVMNDLNPHACKLIEKNLRLNRIRKGVVVEIYNKDANILMLENRKGFDFIDIDPFGSPVNYLHNAAKALKSRSLFACTATDTGCLAGSFPKTCLRKYGIKTVKTDFFKELGIRALITHIVMEFAKNSLVFKPLFSHSNHYFRVIGRVEHGKMKADEYLPKVKFISYCQSCLNRVQKIQLNCDHCGRKMIQLGPLWTGDIKDGGFCKKLLKDFKNKGFDHTKELEFCVKEIDEPFYFDLHKLYKKLKMSPPKIDVLIEKIKSSGFRVSRTSLCPVGIKTNADIKELTKILKGL